MRLHRLSLSALFATLYFLILSTAAVTFSDESMSPAPIHLSVEQRQLLGVTSALVERLSMTRTIRTVGRIDFDERKLADVTLKVGGWVQDLIVDAIGKTVRRGDPLLTLYSPELVVSQQEYLMALQTRERLTHGALPEAVSGSHALVDAARQRLLLWGLTSRQLRALGENGAPHTTISLHAPFSGVVIEKTAQKGMRVEPGMRLYRLADLSTVWLYVDLYEQDIPLVCVGQAVSISLTAYPGETFTGKVEYVYPYVDTQTRTNKARLIFSNTQGKLKPGMYATSEIAIPLGVHATVPESAVLQTGLTNVVFVEQAPGEFTPREVTLGAKANERFIVMNGLIVGERVATNSAFLLDSESKLQSSTSMTAMMGAMGMGDWKMEGARPMDMGGHVKPISPQRKEGGGLSLTVSTTPQPAKLGESDLQVTVKDNTGKPVTDATVTIEYIMDMPGMSIEKVNAQHRGEGVYHAPVHFTMAGPWGITIGVQRSGQAEMREKFTLQVSK